MAKASVKKKSTAGRRRITVFLEAPDAQEVFLIGDFNQWNTASYPMKPDKDGLWSRTLMLEPGTYEYKFIVDGKWQNDPANAQTCENCFGTFNNLLAVSPK
ncbi:Isoamylase N-terminal domain protein [uncultured Desulfatiglans sp.]|uniref:Isoamylase N-terminal domain protein n=1 Tax=Uncultured Desulfatiglans sp. TaxID=1748965 RepID=A0A653A419_UNCDX|nr:Isoamylase N-terminal domain protein [uncultured Desulfatiglans sp.]